MAVWSEATTTEILATRRIDAEFSQPKYLEAERKVRSCNVENLGTLGKFVPGPFGSAFRTSNYDFQSPYRYIRGQDVKPFFILEDDSRFIPQADFIRLQHYAVKKDDLMISVVGTLGNVAVCTERVTPAMFSCKSTIFRTEKVDPYYLLGYLNSHYGQLCLLRRQRGAIQMGLNIEDLRSIPIPRLGDLEEGRIAEKVRKAHNKLISSKESYQSAQQLLESELGLDKLRFQKPTGYVAQLSEAVIGKRFDADYFQTPFRQIQSHLDNLQTAPLYQLVKMVKGIEVGTKAYTASGIPFLRVSNIKEKAIELGHSDKYISDALYKVLSAYQPQVGELLLTKDGTAGVCFAVDEDVNGIISGGIVRLLPRRDDIPNEYLALVINSKVCRMQVEQECSGALILHWKPSSIRKLRIPLLTKPKMQEIADLVSKSKQAKRESERLLEQAKTRVEQLIEEAVQS